MKAFVHFRPDPHYRRDAFARGFQRLGYGVVFGTPEDMEYDDVLVIWNKTSRSQEAIEVARNADAAVIVCENGYYGANKKSPQWFAMALDGHNGSGRWYAPSLDDRRLEALGIEFKPFRNLHSNHFVVAGQRGIGSPQMRSPVNFEQDTARAILDLNPSRTLHIRPHPGRHDPKTPLMDDLRNAEALVVWSSNCATEALINGIPAYYRAPRIVTAGATQRFTPYLNGVFSEEARHQAFSQMAWAQWSVDEIMTGEPLWFLQQLHAGRLGPCRNDALRL